MRSLAGLCLNYTPNAVVQGVKVWGLGWPQVGWPEGSQVLLHPLLSLFGLVGRSWVFLKNGGIPGLDHIHHDVQVDISVDLESRWDEVEGHHLPLLAMTPSAITVAGCFILRTGGTSAAVAEMKQMFLLLMHWSTLKGFLSEKTLMAEGWCFNQFKRAVRLSTLSALFFSVKSCLGDLTLDFIPRSICTVILMVFSSTIISLASLHTDLVGEALILSLTLSTKSSVLILFPGGPWDFFLTSFTVLEVSFKAKGHWTLLCSVHVMWYYSSCAYKIQLLQCCAIACAQRHLSAATAGTILSSCVSHTVSIIDILLEIAEGGHSLDSRVSWQQNNNRKKRHAEELTEKGERWRYQTCFQFTWADPNPNFQVWTQYRPVPRGYLLKETSALG